MACFLSAAGIAAFHGSSGWFWVCIGMAAVLTVAALIVYVRDRATDPAAIKRRFNRELHRQGKAALKRKRVAAPQSIASVMEQITDDTMEQLRQGTRPPSEIREALDATDVTEPPTP